MRLRAFATLLLAAALIWAAPLLGVLAAGHPVSQYVSFPPRPGELQHAPFAWSAFVLLALPAAAAVAVYWIAIANGHHRSNPHREQPFPWWGWLGVVLMAASWFCAWYGGFVPVPWRAHVFTPLWLGYILSINGLTFRHSGWAPLTHRTKWFLALFPVSAAFWWLFEHLNQFVGNWHYSGLEPNGDWEYFVQATLPFATVLPAVASTWAWLMHFPRLDTMRLPAIHGRRSLTWIALAAGVLALACIGIWPDQLFGMLWLAPPLIILALQQLLTGTTLLAPLRNGEWRPLLMPALAGLACGLLWELWNFGSLAKWHYSIPYVQRFAVFEMPLLGYTGYLPFGVECALVIDLVSRAIDGRGVWPLKH